MTPVRRCLLVVATVAVVLVGLAVPVAATGGGKPRPGVLPPSSRPYGATYAEWNARWWQWLYGTDRLDSPVFDEEKGTPADPRPVDCRAGQRGPVWFMGGTFLPTDPGIPTSSSTVFRSCTIPSGVALFFPVLNAEFDNLACPPQATWGFSADQLAAAARFSMDHVVPGSMAVAIDGNDVTGLSDASTIYRSSSPWFAYTLPVNNVGGLDAVCGQDFPPGTAPPAVDGHPGATADGVYLMLPPLSRGKHTIHIAGEVLIPDSDHPVPPAAAFDFIQNINYTITVG